MYPAGFASGLAHNGHPANEETKPKKSWSVNGIGAWHDGGAVVVMDGMDLPTKF
jgi:hypothetical protein